MTSPTSSEPAENKRAGAKPASARRFAVWAAVLAGVAAWSYFKPEAAKTTLVFVLMLSVLVFIHEWGHYQFARWAGLKVNRFAVGFPPWIYTRRHKGVDYSIGALPIGGMVDIAGLGSEQEMVAAAKGEAVPPRQSDARRAHGQREFQDATLGWRFWTLFAGPLMNFVYAFAVFIGVYAFVGIPEPINTNRIVTIHRGSPALQAGVHEGDRLTGVEAAGKTLRSSDVQELKQHIRQSQAPVVTLLLQRSGQELQRTFRPLYEAAPPEDPERDAQGRPLPAMRMKVQFEVQTLYQKVSVAGALQQGWNDVSEMWSGIAGLLFRAATLRLTSDDRGSVGGPVKIAEMVGMYSLLGWAPLLVFSGILSVNLAIMNLLPLPALDGGRILFLGYELVAGRPVDAKKENMVHTGGMVVLLAFMVFITARDVWPLIYNNLP